MLPIVATMYLLASVAAFAAMWRDKRLSQRPGAMRVRESTLHMLSLIGGWPGTLAAQRLFRHKSRKGSFRLVLWMIVLLHVAAWVAAGLRVFV